MPQRIFQTLESAPSDRLVAVKRPMAEMVFYEQEITKHMRRWEERAAMADAMGNESGLGHAEQLYAGLQPSAAAELFAQFPDETWAERKADQRRRLSALGASKFLDVVRRNNRTVSNELAIDTTYFQTNLDIVLDVTGETFDRVGPGHTTSAPAWETEPGMPQIYYRPGEDALPDGDSEDQWFQSSRGTGLYVHRRMLDNATEAELNIFDNDRIVACVPYIASAVMRPFVPDQPPA